MDRRSFPRPYPGLPVFLSGYLILISVFIVWISRPVSQVPLPWQTFTSAELGISLDYPSDLTYRSVGPYPHVSATVSGTIQPSLDKISFVQKNLPAFSLDIYPPSDIALIPSAYSNNYLYMYGLCDLRWLSSRPVVNTNISLGGTPALYVRFPESERNLECYFFKNKSGNLIVAGSYGYSLFPRIMSSLRLSPPPTTDNWLAEVPATPSAVPQKTVPLPPQGWHTYRSTSSDFGINMPDPWFVLDDSLVGIRISNQNSKSDTANGTAPKSGQIIVSFGLTHASAENYSPDRDTYLSAEGLLVTSQGRYLDPSGSLSVRTLYLTGDPAALSFETTVSRLLSTNGLTQTSTVRETVFGHVLPAGLEPAQFIYSKVKNYSGTEYANFDKANMNFPVKSRIPRSGILYADKGGRDWKIFFEIIDGSDSKNNPLDFWREESGFYAVLVDASGAGSGEGVGKLVSVDPAAKKWSIKDCFYYSPESYAQYISKLPFGISRSGAVTKYVDPVFDQANPDYVFDSDSGGFTLSGKIVPGCTDFNLVF